MRASTPRNTSRRFSAACSIRGIPASTFPWEWVWNYYHACQSTRKLAEVIVGPGRAAHAWAAKMRRCLKDKPSGVLGMLRSGGALQSIRGLVGKASAYEQAYGYLRRHASSMDYARCRRLRTAIGSGVTEAACKILFAQPFKRTGMKWGNPSEGPRFSRFG